VTRKSEAVAASVRERSGGNSEKYSKRFLEREIVRLQLMLNKRKARVADAERKLAAAEQRLKDKR
jgi:hypothetical protein